MFQISTQANKELKTIKVFLISVICFIVLLFSSCKSAEKSIVGSWKSDGNNTLYCQCNILTFNEDGTGFLETVIPNEFSDNPLERYDFDYTIEDDVIFIKYYTNIAEKLTEQNFAINDDILTINSAQIKNAKFERINNTR